MRRIVVDILGIFCVGIGLVMFPLPFPIGAILIGLGLFLLLLNEPWVRTYVQECREKSKRVDKGIRWIENHAPSKASAVFKDTAPKEDKEKGNNN